MEAKSVPLLKFIHDSPQYIIPIYQRTYSWTERECDQLWTDILRAAKNEAIKVHFIGSIVYVEEGLSQVTLRSPLLVIDGQQRLTTIIILLAALAEALGEDEPVEGFSKEKLREYYLINRLEKGDRRYKLLLTKTDCDTLKSIIDEHEKPDDYSLNVFENFKLFKKLIAENIDDIADICRGISKLIVVDTALDRNSDNPQLIFESMNSTGRELSQADLIRNFILMDLEPEMQTELYNQYWRRMETDFGQKAYTEEFDSFIRHYLTTRTGDIPRKADVYSAFKLYAHSPSIAEAGVEAMVKDIRDFAKHYCAMALGSEDDKELRTAFQDLKELRVDVAYPLLLELYHDYALNIISREDLVKCVRMIESYVFRRLICAIPTSSLNKTFATFSKHLKKDNYFESFQAHFQSMQSYQRFPSDEEFRKHIQTRDLYRRNRASYYLKRLENHDRKEYAEINEYTIEHIMPQNKNLGSEWKVALGPEWRRIQETWLHTLGNLTLTGYNSEYGDRPFAEKRDMEGGFGQSPLRVNAGLNVVEIWNEEAIKDRAEKLAEISLDVWSAPMLSEDVVAIYKPEKTSQSSYSIDDYKYLQNAPVLEMFMQFRKAVQALDPCVEEDFLKLYIAYKADTNFVDVIPKAKKLRIVLNMDYIDLEDPRKICRDTTGTKRWGNGNVEVDLGHADQLPYVVGLVRQSLERQLGNAG